MFIQNVASSLSIIGGNVPGKKVWAIAIMGIMGPRVVVNTLIDGGAIIL